MQKKRASEQKARATPEVRVGKINEKEEGNIVFLDLIPWDRIS